MSIYELFHYSLFPGLFVAFTYNKKQPPAFGAAPAFWCILLSFLGLSFRHIPNNLSNYNVLTANAPFFYQISGTWSNHEGSILSWCRIPSFSRFCYRGRPQSHNVSKRGGHRETYSFVSVKNSILSLYILSPRYEQKSGATHDSVSSSNRPQLYTPFVIYRRTCSIMLVDSERKRTHPLFLLHLARDDKERASSMVIDDSVQTRRIDHTSIGALGIALFFSPFLSASSDPFVRNFFVRTEPLAESNPVPQDSISAIHPPCIYAGAVASAMAFGLCIKKMMNGLVALHSIRNATGLLGVCNA